MPSFTFPADIAENREAFARASGFLASSVCILTGGRDTAPVAATVSSVTAVSTAPPLLLVCLTNGSATLGGLNENDPISVNVLRAEHRDVAKFYGGSRTASAGSGERTSWADLGIENALARFECSIDRFVPAGDHVVVLLRVRHVRTDNGEPLVYWRRGFCRLHEPHEFLESADTFDTFVSDWRLGLLPRERWTHAAHVAVAAYHAFHARSVAAYGEMREGILRFNRCCGIENTDTSGFHETLTRFWWETVCAFVTGRTFDSAWEAARSTVTEYGSDRDLFRMAYNHDIVGDRVARRSWVPPTRSIAPFPD